jgi:hypothetical protein
MTRQRRQRGPVLPSVVMVLLATVATGLLVVIGFQAVGDSVLPTTFHGKDRAGRNVDVTQSPSTAPRPVFTPAPGTPSATGAPPSQGPSSERPSPRATQTSNGGGPRPTTAPKPVPGKTTAPPPTKKPSPSPNKTPSPSPSQTTQAPSPAPSCGTGRKPRCPSPQPTATSGAQPTHKPKVASYGFTPSGTTATSSFTAGHGHAHSKAHTKAHTAKTHGRAHLAR